MVANRKHNPTEAPVEMTIVADTSIDPRASEEGDELERLQSAQKETAARIKELKAAKKAAKAQRPEAPVNATKALTAKVARLITAGTSQDEAISAVLDQMRAAICARLRVTESAS